MSTRSCIARKEGNGWKGVYHHSDGYPSGLGCYLFRLIRYKYEGDVQAFLDWALSHDGGWSHIFPASVVGRDSMDLATFHTEESAPQCYCHGYFAARDGIKPGQGHGVITGCEWGERLYTGSKEGGPSCDPLFIEWVYVFDPEARTMTVLKSQGKVIPDTVDYTLVHLDGTREAVPQRAYRHRRAATVNLDGPEPDWWEMEKEDFTPEHLEKRETWVDEYLPPVG